MSKSFCLLDDTMTLHGLRFKPEGGDMSRFRDNPILLYMHIRGIVHGRWNNIRLEANKWLADPEFDNEDPDSAKIAGKVDRGFLKACSMGVFPLAVELIDGEPWAVKWIALEGSIVDAGSNANALRLCGENGEFIEDTASHILNLTIPIMSETKKPVPGAEGVMVNVAVPKEIALAAGLAEDATESLIVEKVKEILEENKSLKLSVASQKNSAIKDMLDQAITDKKISAVERPHYEALAAVNFESVKAIIVKIAQPVDLIGLANQTGKTGNNTDDLVAEYISLDKSGKLEKLQAADPVKFNTLYKARWGTEFKA